MTIGNQVLDEVRRLANGGWGLSYSCRQQLASADSVSEVIAGLKNHGIEGLSDTANVHDLARQIAAIVIRRNVIAWSDGTSALGGLLLLGVGVVLSGASPAAGTFVAVIGGLVATWFVIKSLGRRGRVQLLNRRTLRR